MSPFGVTSVTADGFGKAESWFEGTGNRQRVNTKATQDLGVTRCADEEGI